MGLHNLPAWYDAHRLASPEDVRPDRRARFTPSTVSVEIEPDVKWAADVSIPAIFDTKTGDLVSVEIGELTVPSYAFAQMVGDAEFDRVCEAAQPFIEDAAREAAADAEADWADHQNDLRRDH